MATTAGTGGEMVGGYEPTVTVKSTSILSGERTYREDIRGHEIGVLREFAADPDLQEMILCSANIGFVKTYRKVRLGTKAEGT